MSAEHRERIAVGREAAGAVRRYLAALDAQRARPGRRRRPEALRARLREIEGIFAGAEPVTRLQLAQERINLMTELEATEAAGGDVADLEAAFVRLGAAYARSKALSYDAFRAVGVTPRVLKAAGIIRERRG
jgi:hypothetical protein